MLDQLDSVEHRPQASKDLVELLEQREENSPCHTIETHPEILPWTFSLEKMEEDIHRGRMPKVVAQN